MRETNQLTNRSWSHVIGQLAATTLATRLGLFNKWEDCTFMQGCNWSASRRYGSCQVRSFKPMKRLHILCSDVIGRRYCWVGALCSNIGWYFSKKISTVISVMHTEGTAKKLQILCTLVIGRRYTFGLVLCVRTLDGISATTFLL